MNPSDSDRYLREAVWEERWFPDAQDARLVAAHNLGSLTAYDPAQMQQCEHIDALGFSSPAIFERPGTSAVPLSIVSIVPKEEGEWLFRCSSRSPMDLLHPGEIGFLARYAAEVFRTSLRLTTKESFIDAWSTMAPFVAGFIGSTWRVDSACTKISERPHIGAQWGEQQSIASFLKEVNEAWAESHREAQKLRDPMYENNEET